MHLENIYKDQLGWRKEDREEARSNVSKEIFEYAVILFTDLSHIPLE